MLTKFTFTLPYEEINIDKNFTFVVSFTNVL